MFAVIIVVIVSFGFLYDRYNQAPHGPDDVGKIYGRSVRRVEVERNARYFRLAAGMGMIDMVQTLIRTAPRNADENTAMLEFVWNLEVLRHEAASLGIEPTDAQVVEMIKTLPAFQTNGQYDPYKYAEFVKSRIGPLGFTEQQVLDVVRDSLKLSRIREIITSQVAINGMEVDEALKMFQPVDMQVVRFPVADAVKNVVVSNEEIARIYDENKAHFMTNETRGVQYVKIDLPPGFSELKDKASLDAQQKVSDAVTSFVEQARAQGFDAAAKTAGYKVITTPDLTRAGAPGGNADANKVFADLASEAFRLESTGEVNDGVKIGDAYYVISLQKITPPAQLTLEDVSCRIQEKLKDDAARKALNISAQATLEKIRETMKGGKSFADAAAAAGLKVENVPSVTPSPTSETAYLDQEAQQFAEATVFLRDGEISGLENAPWGNYIVYLSKRKPADTTFVTAQKPQIEQFLLRNKEMLIFGEWFRSAREAANLVVPQRG